MPKSTSSQIINSKSKETYDMSIGLNSLLGKSAESNLSFKGLYGFVLSLVFIF